MKQSRPWVTGPAEILEHAVSLLQEDSDRHRRLAMLAIDNGVELALKTYLGLPKRVTGLEITRKEKDDAAHSFPELLDAVEKHAKTKLVGVEVADIEWYHRVRNQLYHEGNGLTVDLEKVHAYLAIAKSLLFEMFEYELDLSRLKADFTLDYVLLQWSRLSRAVAKCAVIRSTHEINDASLAAAARYLKNIGELDEATYKEIERFVELRYTLVEDVGKTSQRLKRSDAERMKELAEDFERRTANAKTAT